MIAATARPAGVAVSTPSLKAHCDSALTKLGNGTRDFGDGAAGPVDRGDDHGVSGPRVVEHGNGSRPCCGGRPAGEFVGEHPAGWRSNPASPKVTVSWFILSAGQQERPTLA